MVQHCHCCCCHADLWWFVARTIGQTGKLTDVNIKAAKTAALSGYQCGHFDGTWGRFHGVSEMLWVLPNRFWKGWYGLKNRLLLLLETRPLRKSLALLCVRYPWNQLCEDLEQEIFPDQKINWEALCKNYQRQSVRRLTLGPISMQQNPGKQRSLRKPRRI